MENSLQSPLYGLSKCEFLQIKSENPDAITAASFGISEQSILEAKTYTYPPLNHKADNGTLLVSIPTCRVSYVRAIDHTTGIITCYESVFFVETNHGYRIHSGASFVVLSKTTEGAILELWNTGLIVSSCGDVGVIKFMQKDFKPDWFDLIDRPSPYIDNGNWIRC